MNGVNGPGPRDSEDATGSALSNRRGVATSRNATHVY